MIVWHPINTAPINEKVLTKVVDDQGEHDIRELTLRGQLWFADTAIDGGDYARPAPTHWTAID